MKVKIDHLFYIYLRSATHFINLKVTYVITVNYKVIDETIEIRQRTKITLSFGTTLQSLHRKQWSKSVLKTSPSLSPCYFLIWTALTFKLAGTSEIDIVLSKQVVLLKIDRGLMCKINCQTKENTLNFAFLRIIHLENIDFYLSLLFPILITLNLKLTRFASYTLFCSTHINL